MSEPTEDIRVEYVHPDLEAAVQAIDEAIKRLQKARDRLIAARDGRSADPGT